jgi:hypothetical protein
MSAGRNHLPGIQTNGPIVAWGSNDGGECNVPAPNAEFTSVVAGFSHSLALRPDGTLALWGFGYAGGFCYLQGLDPSQNSGFVAMGAGLVHSLGLKFDGSILGWGVWDPECDHGQTRVPALNSGFVAVAAGMYHSLGLKADGSVVAWGANSAGQCTVPPPDAGFTAVAAGWFHSLGLKSDGSVAAWGSNYSGQCSIPVPNNGFVAVAAGGECSVGLKSVGLIVAWGSNDYGQCNVPTPNADFVAVAAGTNHSLGLKSDGSIVAWGNNDYGQCNVPTPNADFVAVAAGDGFSLGLRGHTIAVTFSDVAAEAVKGSVLLRWVVALDQPGRLRVLRANDPEGAYEPIGPGIEVAVGRSTSTYQDTSVENDHEYFYKLACRESGPWTYSSPVRVVTPAQVFAFSMVGASPSSGGASRFQFELDRPGRVQLDVFDVAGHRVRTILQGAYGAGVHPSSWDGCTEDGSHVASGVYWVKLSFEGRGRTAKVVVAR